MGSEDLSIQLGDFPTATAVSYGLSKGFWKAYPQSMDRRGHEVWIKVEICGLNRANFAGDSSDSRIWMYGIGVLETWS